MEQQPDMLLTQAITAPVCCWACAGDYRRVVVRDRQGISGSVAARLRLRSSCTTTATAIFFLSFGEDPSVQAGFSGPSSAAMLFQRTVPPGSVARQ